MKTQRLRGMLFIFPVVVILFIALLYPKQFSLPIVENRTVIINTLQHNELYQLKDGWTFYEEGQTEATVLTSTPAQIATTKNGTLMLKLRVPQEKQLYSLTLNGLKQPFTAFVNNEAVQGHDTIHFYATQPLVHIELVIQNNGNRIALLQTPLLGSVDAVHNYQLKKYIFSLFTALTLTLVGFYCIAHYARKQRYRQQFYIGLYFLLVSLLLLLSGENLAMSLLHQVPSVLLIKLKTIIGLLCALPLAFITRHYRKVPLSKRAIWLLSVPTCIAIALVIFMPSINYWLLEMTIWLYLIVFLIVQVALVAIHCYRYHLLSRQVILLLHAFVYLISYLCMRIYYNLLGSDFNSDWLLLAFIVFIISSLIMQTTELVSELEQSKISFFNAQIKPHFIYNALSNIIALCYTDNKKAAALLSKFSTYLRLVFEKSETTSTVPLSEELTLIDAYVEIEQARFPNRITYSLFVDDDLLAMRVPAFSIQPFVENAIRHGLFNREKPGQVSVSITKAHGQLVIRIEDNGIGMSEETVQQVLTDKQPNQGIGITNVKKRLLLLANAQLHIQSARDVGTAITIQFPLNKEGHLC